MYPPNYKKAKSIKKSLLLTSHMNLKCTVGAETSIQKNPSPTKTVKKDVNKKKMSKISNLKKKSKKTLQTQEESQ